jgi:hypothetical protein
MSLTQVTIPRSTGGTLIIEVDIEIVVSPVKPNAFVYVRMGKAQVEVRTGKAQVEVRTGKAQVEVRHDS